MAEAANETGYGGPMRFAPDRLTEQVLELVERRAPARV